MQKKAGSIIGVLYCRYVLLGKHQNNDTACACDAHLSALLFLFF